MDFLSGNLDHVFSVLFELGYVDKMLKKDWRPTFRDSSENWKDVGAAIRKLNEMNSLKDIRSFVEGLPINVIDALVVEVAREYAEFAERGEMLH